MNFDNIVNFWFQELSPKDWFQVDPNLDLKMKNDFAHLVESASRCELFHWRRSPKGRLAEILVLDQFSRNIYRGTPRAFAQDNLALALAQEAVSLKIDQSLDNREKKFIYMPYMHSESLLIHEEAVRIFSQPGLEDSLSFELKHKVIIERFHRYPHRNKILNRTSTPEEISFLMEPDSSF
jgi:uncharacterized protein (DUF924 family)